MCADVCGYRPEPDALESSLRTSRTTESSHSYRVQTDETAIAHKDLSEDDIGSGRDRGRSRLLAAGP